MNWHSREIKDLLADLNSTSDKGLSAHEAGQRLAENGANELIEQGGRTIFKILWEQVSATLVLILVGAAVLSGILGDTKNTTAILSIVFLFVILGLIQEYRAEKAISALKKMSVPKVKALRDGIISEIFAGELVTGDIVNIETGNIIAADIRIIESINLSIQESALTGESEPIEKITDPLPQQELPLGDRINMAFTGTIVTRGRGTGLVVATGMKTELGKIAGLIQGVKQEQTPLQKRLDSLGKSLAIIGVAVSAAIFAIGVWRGDEIRHMLLTAVSVAVAIVPEGLPAVVTITLALGAQRMLKRKALIRKLPAVETLGSVTVICSDKTGTLTENRMTVVVLDVAGHTLDLSGEMDRHGHVFTTNISGDPILSSLALAVVGSALCNDTTVTHRGDDTFHLYGDPTETALVAAAMKMNYKKTDLDASFRRVAEIPFDSGRKRMTTVHEIGNFNLMLLPGVLPGSSRFIAFTKGGVDSLMEVSNSVWVDGVKMPLDEVWRSRILNTNGELAGKGMRVLGVAFRLHEDISSKPDNELEKNLTMAGIFGMIDPPRSEVKDAVAACISAGIRPVMITGDHPLTAVEIARQLGISANGKVLTGIEIENFSHEELKKSVMDVNVFARVAPEHKLRIVQALQELGHIVSMTGDGVNDAPALRRADIGVAMGITGTDVSKEASDLVLLDDNFATIVAAVKEGRTIYENIRKFVRFSVAGNIGKVLVMLLAPFLGKPLPLLPLQLLWLNLLTDGLLGLGMGVENPEPDTMKQKPSSPEEGIFSRRAGVQTVITGVLIGSIALIIGGIYFFSGRDEWRTMVFTSLAFMQVFQAIASRSTSVSVFKTGILGNRVLFSMILLVVFLQCLIIYTPGIMDFFEVVPLGVTDMAVCAGSGVIILTAIELMKKAGVKGC